MPRVDRKIEINASVNRIYEILIDAENILKWNITANEIDVIEPRKKAFLKTNVGDMTVITTEDIENEKISYSIEGNPILTGIGYVIKPKGDITEVTIWGEFSKEEQEKILVKAGEVLLKSLKNYIEYLEEGGDPDKYDKKQIMVSP